MKRLLFASALLFLFAFLTRPTPVVAQGSTSCSVNDIVAGQTPTFTAKGLEKNHDYTIQVVCTTPGCSFNRNFCLASDDKGEINQPLFITGGKWEINGVYQAHLGEVRLPFPCSRNTDPEANYCAPTFEVSGATRDFPGTCTAGWVNAVCTVKEDNCNKAAGYVAGKRLAGREGTACLCECVRAEEAREGSPLAGYEPEYCNSDRTEIKTALGCIPVGDTTQFIGWLLRWAIGIAGGIAFLLILFAGFQIITSSGDPERLKAGRDLLTSAIAGLVLIIFSVFLLRLIGVQILQLPGL